MKTSISLAQFSTDSKDPKKNLIKTEAFLKQAKNLGSTIAIFPEMWVTGFNSTYTPETVKSLATLAKDYSLWIGGSLPLLNEERRITNTFVLFNPEGSVSSLYNKIHLFPHFCEEIVMSAGTQLTLFEQPWGTNSSALCGYSICYDLRFPELFRSYALQGAKVIFLVAAFPHPRLEHWKTLIKARAIENQLYMVCVNRVGSEEFQGVGEQMFFGSSMIVNPWGEILVSGNEKEEVLLTAEIDLAMVDKIRNDINVFKDRRPEIYKL